MRIRKPKITIRKPKNTIIQPEKEDIEFLIANIIEFRKLYNIDDSELFYLDEEVKYLDEAVMAITDREEYEEHRRVLNNPITLFKEEAQKGHLITLYENKADEAEKQGNEAEAERLKGKVILISERGIAFSAQDRTDIERIASQNENLIGIRKAIAENEPWIAGEHKDQLEKLLGYSAIFADLTGVDVPFMREVDVKSLYSAMEFLYDKICIIEDRQEARGKDVKFAARKQAENILNDQRIKEIVDNPNIGKVYKGKIGLTLILSDKCHDPNNIEYYLNRPTPKEEAEEKEDVSEVEPTQPVMFQIESEKISLSKRIFPIYILSATRYRQLGMISSPEAAVKPEPKKEKQKKSKETVQPQEQTLQEYIAEHGGGPVSDVYAEFQYRLNEVELLFPHLAN
ncbi:MAG: hypothetical protein ISS25_01820 [Nanoarchaeota archaeon]|nr:hypothetical protein [DPANN group archaeon]MBL7116543.1 hypothetical protein [Nanoarchaeota archaeon]